MTVAISQEYVFGLLQSKEQFPIDFEAAWNWIGYTRKDSAKKKLVKNFLEGADFSAIRRKSPTGGRSIEHFLLTIDCFKQLAMMAGTSCGREVREHFLECERKLKLLSNDGTRHVSGKIPMQVFNRFLDGVEGDAVKKAETRLRLVEAAHNFLEKHPHDRDILMLILKE